MAKFSYSRFFREQTCEEVKPVVQVDLTGKTVVIVGANTGLGFEATKHFASMNPGRLILGCRNEAKGKAAVEKIRNETGYIKAELWIIDLSSFSSVKSFADRWEREGGRLDILVENAGILPTDTYELTSDGWPAFLQTNDLAPSLHSLLLLPYMLRTAEEYGTTPRLVFVTSDLHYQSKILKHKQVVQSPSILKEMATEAYHKRTSAMDRYYDSKLFNVYFTRTLQDRLPSSPFGSTVIVNCLNPGFCHSEFRRDVNGVVSLVNSTAEKLLAFTTEEGSRQIVYAAVGERDNEIKLKGAYISFGDVVEPADAVVTPEGGKMQERYWNEVVDVCSRADSRIPEILSQHLKTGLYSQFSAS